MKISRLFIVITVLKCTGTLSKLPTSITGVAVVKGGGYEIGFPKSNNTKMCYYKSSMNDKVFSVDPTKTGEITIDGQIRENHVIEMGQMGLCKITVLNASINGPVHWEIVPNNGTHNVSKIIYTVNFFTIDDFRPLPQKTDIINLIEGTDITFGYFQHVGIKKCTFSSKKYNFEFQVKKLTTFQEVELTPGSKENDISHIGHSELCQLHIKNVNTQLPTIWTITISDGFINLVTITKIFKVYPKSSIVFTPNLNEIYVREGDDVELGFNFHQAITGCKYETNQQTSHIVDFLPKDMKSSIEVPIEIDTWKKSIVAPNINYTVCKLKIKKASEQEIHLVTLTALSNGYKIRSVTVSIHYYEQVPVFVKKLKVGHGYNFFQSLQMTNINASLCTLHYGDNTVDYSVREDIHPRQIADSKIVTSITEYNHGICGFHFDTRVLFENPRNYQWTVVATTHDNKKYGGTFDLIISPIKPRHKSVLVALGSNVWIECGDVDEQKLCELYNTEHHLVYKGNKCRYFIENLDMYDLGIWKCFALENGFIHQEEYFVYVVVKENSQINWQTTEKVHSQDIQCILKPPVKITSCQMISPHRNVYFVNEYLITSRMSGISSDFDNGVCTLRIMLPLDNTEEGVWTCVLETNLGTFSTSPKVTTTRKILQKNVTIPTFFEQAIKEDEELFLLCQVPYSSKSCYFLSPSGEPFMDEGYFNPKAGECSLTVSSDYPSREGLWNCFFAREQPGEPDIKIDFEVKVHKQSSNFTSITINEGEELKLSYYSGGEPISGCTFISPSKDSFYTNTSTKIDYCLLDISNVQKNDYGIWTCIPEIGFDSRQLQSHIQIEVAHNPEKLSISDRSSYPNIWLLSLGIIFGLILVITILLATLHWKRKSKRIIGRNHEELNMSYFEEHDRET